MSKDKKNEKDIDSFVRLLANHQGQIYSYILSLVGNFNDADDVLQETFSKMWDFYDNFQPGTDFLKWSLAIAHYRILDYRNKLKRDRKFIYSEDFFSRLSDVAHQNLSKTNEYLEMLKKCVSQLKKEDEDIVKMRYGNAMHVREIALRVDKTTRNIYYALARIQRLLLKCMNQS
jgi:RNA polymerase sigma-70 factor (ECF subfamily)